jgi:hypothetical protein
MKDLIIDFKNKDLRDIELTLRNLFKNRRDEFY